MLREYVTLVGSVLVIALAFRGLERLAPAERGQPHSSWLFNLAYTPFILIFIILLNVVFGPAYARVSAYTGGGLLPEFAGEESGAAAHLIFALVYFLVWDICQYALHRLQHALPVLWETHKFHHSETALNSTTQAKVHALSYVLALLFHLPVVVLFGPRAPHFVAAFLMFRLWGFFNHMNVRAGLGPFTPLVSGPQWHRLHHSIRVEHYNKNFATFFPFIDILFGTYRRPGADEYPPTGLAGEPPGGLGAATVGPLHAWYRMARRRRGEA
jgi:sterol desaturase/sphingolipid hydroxylase (fatty acid hydroxylase superfamily)